MIAETIWTMSYTPKPIDTSTIQLKEGILELTERLAENAHDVRARQRLADGWTYGPERDDAAKNYPCLVQCHELPDSENGNDRHKAVETIKGIMALGYTIEETTT